MLSWHPHWDKATPKGMIQVMTKAPTTVVIDAAIVKQTSDGGGEEEQDGGGRSCWKLRKQ